MNLVIQLSYVALVLLIGALFGKSIMYAFIAGGVIVILAIERY